MSANSPGTPLGMERIEKNPRLIMYKADGSRRAAYLQDVARTLVRGMGEDSVMLHLLLLVSKGSVIIKLPRGVLGLSIINADRDMRDAQWSAA